MRELRLAQRFISIFVCGGRKSVKKFVLARAAFAAAATKMRKATGFLAGQPSIVGSSIRAFISTLM
jgi:hypothetical protein